MVRAAPTMLASGAGPRRGASRHAPPGRGAGTIACLYLLAVLSLCSGAAPPEITISISDRAVELGNRFLLQVHCRGDVAIPEAPVVPPIDGMEIRPLAPSTQFMTQVINGRTTTSRAITFNYELVPSRTGTFTVPSMRVAYEGGQRMTEPISLTVTAPAGLGASGAPAQISDFLRLVARIPGDPPYVYLRQEVPLEISILWRQIDRSDIQVDYPQFPRVKLLLRNFADVNPRQPDFQSYTQSTVVMDGKEWEQITFRTAFYPIGAGTLRLDPITTTARLRVESQRQRRPRSIFDSFFNDSFFSGSPFGSEYRDIPLNAPALELVVRDLPAAGRPDSFGGAVGRFAFETAVQPTELRVGEPLSLRITVRGEGDLSTVQQPTLPALDQFKVYEPTATPITRELGAAAQRQNLTPPLVGMTYEWVLIPTTIEAVELPAIELAYFDPQRERYEIVREGPFPLKIAPAPEGQAAAVVSAGPRRASAGAAQERDIVYLKTRWAPRSSHPVGPMPARLWAVQAIPILALAGLATLRVARERRARDTARARRARAPRTAQAGLRQAERALHAGDAPGFYTAVQKTLQEFLGHLLNIPAAGMTAEVIEQQLRPRGLPEQLLEELAGLFQACDRARFAGFGTGADDMQRVLETTRTVVNDIHREARSRRRQ